MGKIVQGFEIEAYLSLRKAGFSHRRSAQMVGRAHSTMRLYDPYQKPYDNTIEREKTIRRYLRRALTNELNSNCGFSKGKHEVALKDVLAEYPDLHEDLRKLAQKFNDNTEILRLQMRAQRICREARELGPNYTD